MTDHQPENPSQGPLDYYLEEDSRSLTDILLILARHIRIILITPMILCTLTIIYVLFIADPVYTSTSKIMSSSGGGSVLQAAGLAAQLGINIPTGQSEPKWIYLEIIKSRTLSRAILKRKFDTEEFGPKKSLLQILTYGNKDESIHGMDTLEIMAVNTLLGMIDVAEKKALELGSRFIHLDVRETQEAAIKLFELKGYKKWGINPYYAFVDGKNLKGHYFFKKLK